MGSNYYYQLMMETLDDLNKYRDLYSKVQGVGSKFDLHKENLIAVKDHFLKGYVQNDTETIGVDLPFRICDLCSSVSDKLTNLLSLIQAKISDCNRKYDMYSAKRNELVELELKAIREKKQGKVALDEK